MELKSRIIRPSRAISLIILLTVQLPIAICRAAQSATTQSAPESRVDLPPSQIQHSIAEGVKYLIGQQSEDGSWGTESIRMAGDLLRRRNAPQMNTDRDGGRTALVTLALLSAGESPQSEPLRKAIEFLKAKEMTQTYSIALRACVFSQLPESVRTKRLADDVIWLRRAIIAKGLQLGLYGYTLPTDLNDADLSNSQYGVLGMWYAAEAGVDVPADYWHKVEIGWTRAQNKDGGWAYRGAKNARDSYMSMTVAGLATLFITHDYLHANEAHTLPANAKNAAIDHGLQWLAENFDIESNHGVGQLVQDETLFVHYMLFGYERVGEAAGLSRFGEHVWFDEGAHFLLETQRGSGYWKGTLGPLVDTAYSLLFLSRGIAPVVMQKLQFDGHWNNRPRDAANIIRWLRRETERHVNWQIVSADASPAELRQSPILYLASESAPKFSDDQKSRIKQYLDEGGLLLCVNEGTGDAFTTSIEQLAKEMYPQYALRELPPSHLIFNENFTIKNYANPVMGVSNGVRELIVLLPKGDMSWQWQSMSIGKANPMQAFPLAGNLYLYTTGKTNPRLKGESPWVVRQPNGSSSREIVIARLRYKGNWDPEPAGWLRLANILYNENGIDLHPRALALGEGQLKKDFKFAHLTATGKLQLSAPQIAELKQFIDAGGTLLFDSAGGSPDTARDFEEIVSGIYPDAKWQSIPLDHPMYTGESFGGKPISSVVYRRSILPRRDPTKPSLRGLTINSRLAVICSADDLSAALAGCQSDGITGYSISSATDLVANIVRWSTALSNVTP